MSPRPAPWAAAALLLASCHRPDSGPPPGSSIPPATTAVAAHAIESRMRVASEEMVGTVRSRQSAAIASKLTATILQLDVWPGQRVRAGDTLVLLDAREVDARLAQARALLDQALREEARLRGLASQRAVASQDLDNAVSRREVAEAGLREAQTRASDARLVAPFDGVIVSRLAEAGDLATPGRSLLVVENPEALRVEVQLPESLLPNLHVGDPLPIAAPAAPTAISARITEIAPAADPVSRTFLMKADLLPGAAGGLRSGQFVRVRVPLGEVETIEVPSGSVVRRGQMEMTFVFDPSANVVRQRLIRTGRVSDTGVEVLSGLAPGERIVAAPATGLKDGAPLVPVPEARP